MTEQLPLVCPVCARPAPAGPPLIERWRRLLEHLETAHDFYAEMLAIAWRSDPGSVPVSGGGATAAGSGFYPRGEAW